MADSSIPLVPVTVLTGFLGSGKTTLLNHILTATHGKKIAVIENEFGEVGVDDELLSKNTKMQADEDIIEMMNGCICCTVRQDLIVVLEKLAKRVKAGTLKLDGIIIETCAGKAAAECHAASTTSQRHVRRTGMADPAPVAQTFFVDDKVKSFAKLDGIVTLVDAKHVEQHLDEEKPEGAENEAVEQVAFADRILLNKTDLVEKRLKSINSQAPVQRCTKAEVSPDWVLNIGAFDLKRVIEMDPEFLNTNGEHEHDTSVSSVALTEESTPLDLAAIEDWIGGMLKTQGADIYRMKGVLHIAHAEQRFVYHAVHMIFNGDFTEPWEEDEPRESKLVFIGKNLDAAELKARFEACLATPANLEKKLQALRFQVGDRVMCHLAGDPDADANGYVKGTITQLMWRSEDMDPGMVAPYQITMDSGDIISAPADSDDLVKRAPEEGDAAAKRQRQQPA